MKSILQKTACAAVAVLALGSAFFIPGGKVAKAETPNAEKRYYDGFAAAAADNNGIAAYSADSTTETVNYTNREVTSISTPGGAPLYTGDASVPNGCGAVSGTIIAGYYDRYYEDLIPNYSAYNTSNGSYRSMVVTSVRNVMQELFTLMRTNVDDVGVSEDDCLSGLRSYVEGVGRSITYSSVGTSFNLTSYLNAINSGKPVMLFCDNVGIANISSSSNTDTISTVTVPNGHIVIGYGYYQINYYNGTVKTRTDTYIRAATGLDYGNQLIRLNSYSWYDSGYAITIS